LFLKYRYLFCFLCLTLIESTAAIYAQNISNSQSDAPTYDVLWNGEKWDKREPQENSIETFLRTSPDIIIKAELYYNALSALSSLRPEDSSGLANSENVQNLVQNSPYPQIDWHLVNAMKFHEALQENWTELKRRRKEIQKADKDDAEELKRYEDSISRSNILPTRTDEFIRLHRDEQKTKQKNREKDITNLRATESEIVECENYIKREILSYLMLMFSMKKLENTLMAHSLYNSYYFDEPEACPEWQCLLKDNFKPLDNKTLSDIQKTMRNNSLRRPVINEELIKTAVLCKERFLNYPQTPRQTYLMALSETQKLYKQVGELVTAVRKKELKKSLTLLEENYPNVSALTAFAKISHEDRVSLLNYIETCQQSDQALQSGNTAKAKAILIHIKELSVDFDLATEIKKVNKREAEIQAYLASAFDAASRGDEKELNLQIEGLNKIATGNINVSEQVKRATELGVIQKNKLHELDILFKEWDVKKIYNWQKSQSRFQDKDRQQKLDNAIEEYQNQQASLEKVKAFAALPGGSYQAWEEAEKESKKYPGNEELLLYVKQLTSKVSSYTEPLKTGDSLYTENNIGSSFYYYLMAADAYPEGKKAKAMLHKLAEETYRQWRNAQ
jgi:hypothetical protein